jgi:hypothetical protein
MAIQHLRTLQLQPTQVETAADFYEAYASHILSRASRVRLSEVDRVDVASSLRMAGQWAMLFDSQRASDLLARAAEIWHDMGYGFGTFVLAAVDPGRLDRAEFVNRLVQVARLYDPRGIAGQLRVAQLQPSEPLFYPQQQAYLLLAGASMWPIFQLPLDILHIIGDQSPHRRGAAPVGALGIPIRLYWDIARRLLQTENKETDDEQSAASVAQDLARMGLAYSQSVDSAMANERLWFNAASPVDVGDIDIVSIALAAARRLGTELTRTHLQAAAEELDATARVPLELANEMMDIEPPSPQGIVRKDL